MKLTTRSKTFRKMSKKITAYAQTAVQSKTSLAVQMESCFDFHDMKQKYKADQLKTLATQKISRGLLSGQRPSRVSILTDVKTDI